jgi:uncharacterized protein (TIGR00290 family)
MMRGKVLVSWSSGKDSAWMLHMLRSEGVWEVGALLTTVNRTVDRVAMHGVRRSLVERQAEALDVPLWSVYLPFPCDNLTYDGLMAEAVARAVASGFTHVAFGDLFLEDVRRYREDRLATTGLTPLFPIWGRETGPLVHEMIDAGVRARICCLDPRRLDRTFVGRELEFDVLAAFPANVDPCGERGEYHTFAYDGPMFTRPLDVRSGVEVERDGFVYVDLRLTEHEPEGARAAGLDGSAEGHAATKSTGTG